jgi:hypothetical protein
MNLFYKIHLQSFNVISIVLYHRGPTFGKVLYSCLDVFVSDASDYSGHLIRHLLNASEAFPTELFLQFLKRKHTVCRTSDMTHICKAEFIVDLSWFFTVEFLNEISICLEELKSIISKPHLNIIMLEAQ